MKLNDVTSFAADQLRPALLDVQLLGGEKGPQQRQNEEYPSDHYNGDV